MAELAAARKITVEHQLISVGGASLRTHWNPGRAAKAIETDLKAAGKTLPAALADCNCVID